MADNRQSWTVLFGALFFGMMMLYFNEARERENCEGALQEMTRHVPPARLRRLREEWDAEQEFRLDSEP